jgi:ABC-type glycerol-3-phosphate transport system permease component
MLKAQVVGTGATEWNVLMAGAVLIMIPNVLVFLVAQKYFIKGLAVGGLRP